MKPSLLSALALLALLPLASCSNQSSAAKPADSTSAHRGRHRHKTPSDAAQTAAVKPYPLKTCLVSGEELDPKDEVVSTVYKGQEVKFCCKNCLAKFNKDPEKYMAKLNKA